MSVRFNNVTKSWETVPFGVNSIEAIDQERRDTIPAPPPEEESPATPQTGTCPECRRRECRCQFEIVTVEEAWARGVAEVIHDAPTEPRIACGEALEPYDLAGEGR